MTSRITGQPDNILESKMSDQTAVASAIGATQPVPLTAFQTTLDTWLDVSKKEQGAVRKAALMALEIFDKDDGVKRRWILKITRTGHKPAQLAYDWVTTQVKERAKAAGEVNVNMKLKRFMDEVKQAAGIAKPKAGSSGKEEIKFVEEAARMLQNHLFKTAEGQCHALKNLWDHFQEACIEDGVIKADA